MKNVKHIVGMLVGLMLLLGAAAVAFFPVALAMCGMMILYVSFKSIPEASIV